MLNFLYTDEKITNLLCWGLEGEHYQKNGDGTISYPDGKDESEIGYNFNLNWMLPNPYLAYVWKGDDLNLQKNFTSLIRRRSNLRHLGLYLMISMSEWNVR